MNSSNISNKHEDTVYEYKFSDIFPFQAIYLIKPREKFIIPCFVSTGYSLAIQKRREKSRNWDTVMMNQTNYAILSIWNVTHPYFSTKLTGKLLPQFFKIVLS